MRPSELMVGDPISSAARPPRKRALFADKGTTRARDDQGGRPIGVLSDPIFQHQVEQSIASGPSYFVEPSDDSDENLGATPHHCLVSDLMTPAVFACSLDTPIERVVSDMVGLRVHRLFVVDDAGALVGVISTMDLLKQLRPDE